MYDNQPRCSPRAQRIAIAVLGIVLALGLILVPGQAPAAKAAAVQTTPNRSSCVATVAGLTSSNTVAVSSTSSVQFWFKCYYDPTSGVRKFLNSTYTAPAGCIQVVLPGPGSFTCSASAPYNLRMTRPTVTRSETGYVEFNYTASCPTSCLASNMTGYRTYSVASKASILFQGGNITGSSETQFWMGMYQTSTTPLVDTFTGNYVPQADFATSYPPNRWGADFGLTPCQQLRMFINNPGRTIAPGSTMSVQFLEGWPAVMASSTVVLRYRWSPSEDFTTWYNANSGGGLIPSTQTFTNNTGQPRTGVTFEVHCAGDGGAYLRGDNSPGGTAPQARRACSALTMAWPAEGLYEGNEVVWLTLNVGDLEGGSIDEVLVKGGRFGNEQSHALTEVVDADSISWMNPGGTTSMLPIDSAGEYKGGFWFANEWNTDDGLALRCKDAAGFLNFTYEGPSSVGKLPLPESYGSRFDECITSIEFGWRPSSWAPAFLTSGTCIAQVMFVPIDDDVAALVDSGQSLAAKAPVAYVVEIGGVVYDVLDGMPEAMAAHRSDCIAGIPLSFEGTATETFCPIEYEDSFEEIRFFLGAFLWVSFGVIAYHYVRRTIA